jgi:hypothetical protein
MKTQKQLLQKIVIATMILFFACSPFQSQAQDDPMFFVVVDFMKVKAGDEGKYVDLEKNVWKPIHQERINQGEIIGWILYQVHYTGSDDEYNFVTASVFDDPSRLEHTFRLDMEKVHPDMDLEKAFQETMESRDLVKQQLLRRIDAVFPEGAPADYEYIQVNKMKVNPSMGGEYVSQEVDVWKPVHQELIDNEARAGWSLWETTYPTGMGMEYNFVTVDYFKDFSKIGAADVFGAFEKVHPDKDPMDLINAIGETRDHVKAELWRVVDSVWKQ